MAAANESRITSFVIAVIGGAFIGSLMGRLEKLEDRDRENLATVAVLRSEVVHLGSDLSDANTTLKEINAKLTLLGR